MYLISFTSSLFSSFVVISITYTPAVKGPLANDHFPSSFVESDLSSTFSSLAQLLLSVSLSYSSCGKYFIYSSLLITNWSGLFQYLLLISLSSAFSFVIATFTRAGSNCPFIFSVLIKTDLKLSTAIDSSIIVFKLRDLYPAETLVAPVLVSPFISVTSAIIL